MSDNENKGELIKKNNSPKKVVVLKKKKIIIKKQGSKNENESIVDDNIKIPSQEINDNKNDNQEIKKKDNILTNEKVNVTQNQNSTQKNDFANKQNYNRNQNYNNRPNYNYRPNQNNTNQSQNQNNTTQNQANDKRRIYTTKKPLNSNFPNNNYPKTNFSDNKNVRPNTFNKTTPGGQQTPVQKNDKERSRKKINQKRYDEHNKSDFQQEIQKAYNKKKKEKDFMLSVPDKVDIIDVISISDLAKKMNLKTNAIISKLMELGMMVTINDKIDSDTASIVASEFNCKVNVVSLYDETVIEDEKEIKEDLKKRPPIVTVMGHVDHGKTKLLDAIRSENVAMGESGGITQHIGAYTVKLDNDEQITFIDTPGHEAFSMMRARGAEVTDIVILVVAADDGVMPQTIEAINHAKSAKVPIIVAINKIDKPEANIERIKQQLTEYELLPEEWGGHTLYCEVSALKKIGINELLETIILQSEMMELKASTKIKASGFVLESKIDHGKGVVASVLILKGVLKLGDNFVAGIYSGKARSIFNDKGEKIKIAYPSMPIEITGLENVPNAGDPFNVTATEKEAKVIASKRQELNRMEDAKSVKKVTINELLTQKKEGEVQEIKIIIKADVQGSAQAIKDSLSKLSNKEIRLVTVSSGVGAINKDDVMLAVASNAINIGFHVRPNPAVQLIADKEKVQIKRYNIIYDVIEVNRAAMEGMIKPDLMEELIGTS